MSKALRESFFKATIRKTKYSARNVRGLSFNITLEDVMAILDTQDGKCALSGWPLEFVRGGDFGHRNPYAATLDRKDNSRGYEKDNIQIVCCKVNVIRSSLSMDEFLEICRSVTNHTKFAR